MKISSPRRMRERLDERFRVLMGGGRDVVPRQQTLRALIDWSHDLLDATMRRFNFKREFTETMTDERLHALPAARLDDDEREGFPAQGAALLPEAAIALGLEDE